MRKLVQVENVEGEGFYGLLGETVTLFCGVYIYTGILEGVNDEFVKLKNPCIVYETGPYTSSDGSHKKWKDAQKLPRDEWYVMKNAIESFGIMKQDLKG